MTTNRLLDHLRRGGVAIGGWCTTGSPLAAELLAVEGFDYVCADCQHGLMSYDGMVPVLHAVARTGVTPLVRVASNLAADIGKALDAGAEGIIVPMVGSPAEAAQAVASCRYPPEGTRSFGPVRSGLFLGADPPAVNRQVLCLVMIETVEGVAAADEICATPGLDGVYLGPADLAVSMGLSPAPGSPSPEHAAAIETVRRACERAGIVAGIHSAGGAETAGARAAEYVRQGFRMVTVSTDAGLLRAAAASGLAAARAGGAVTPPAGGTT